MTVRFVSQVVDGLNGSITSEAQFGNTLENARMVVQSLQKQGVPAKIAKIDQRYMLVGVNNNYDFQRSKKIVGNMGFAPHYLDMSFNQRSNAYSSRRGKMNLIVINMEVPGSTPSLAGAKTRIAANDASIAGRRSRIAAVSLGAHVSPRVKYEFAPGYQKQVPPEFKQSISGDGIGVSLSDIPGYSGAKNLLNAPGDLASTTTRAVDAFAQNLVGAQKMALDTATFGFDMGVKLVLGVSIIFASAVLIPKVIDGFADSYDRIGETSDRERQRRMAGDREAISSISSAPMTQSPTSLSL